MSKQDELYKRIVSDLERPYFHNIKLYGLDESEEEMIILHITGGDEIKKGSLGASSSVKEGKTLYIEFNSGSEILWSQHEYDHRGNKMYTEDEEGRWVKWRYDEDGTIVYTENSEGYWERKVYDDDGNYIETIRSIDEIL
jgi:hypothetical protein